ncbi:GGDEF domain-containing protein [Actinoplanes hulinensis]|uniref:GGDEF domain-containing protein n=1 Tax=Actinoplanes hulinensis TaxID=1144547 RepID=A0ABS7B203_9ACTN|nr:GGDEF domain-containing protein [Actinoplanes hulinensis]MBW6435070.1 GGDEF domain-containing protein [Actinoplanes hulinensis]
MLTLRRYVALAGLAVVTYPAWPAHQQGWVLLAVCLSPLPALVTGLRRTAPGAARLAWWLLLAGTVVYDIGNAVWAWRLAEDGRLAADADAVVGVTMTTGGALMLAASLTVVLRRGRADIGGIIDSVIAAIGLSGVLWSIVLLPAMTADGLSTGQQIIRFLNVFLLAGTLGGMLRVSLVAHRSAAPALLLCASVAFALAQNVSSVIGADWQNIPYMAAFVAVGGAALHPSMAQMTTPGPTPADDLTTGRLVFLGIMLAIAPVICGARAVLGLPSDGLLLAISSAGMIPLVMARIAGLSRARRAAETALHRLATSDSLTGLPNRAACVDRITRELAAGPDDLAVLFCDLDGFKPVNDRLGHAAGDALLIGVAEHLRARLRAEDLVGRFGGDEFVIVCRGPGAADAMVDRVRTLAARSFTVGGEQVRIGVSVGVADAQPHDTTDAILTRADLAMYEAKKRKKVGVISVASA